MFWHTAGMHVVEMRHLLMRATMLPQPDKAATLLVELPSWWHDMPSCSAVASDCGVLFACCVRPLLFTRGV